MVVGKVFDEVSLVGKYQEIRELQEIENEVALEIGRILYEVRSSSITDGKWTEWIESIGYNARTARRYIQVYTQFRDVPDAKKVAFSKLVELLPLPVDVDRAEFLSEVKDRSVREIREAVKSVNKVSPNDSPVQEKVDKPRSDGIRTRVGKSVSSLLNLIPYYASLFECGEISAEMAIEIGGFSAKTQERLYEYESENSKYIDARGVIALLVDANFSREDILKCVRIIDCIAFDYVRHKEVDDQLKELYENINLKARHDDVIGLFDALIKFEERVIELEKELAARGSNIDEAYQEKLFGKYRRSGNGSNQGNSYSSNPQKQKLSADVRQILGVGDDADSDAMKKQYRLLMKVLHPDVGGSPYLFQLVKDAYDEYTDGKSA